MTQTDFMIYTIWAVFGFLIIDFLVAFFQRFWEGNFDPAFVLDYLKDILYYIFPLNIIITMIPLDPTGWVLVILYFIGGAGIILKYLMDVIRKFHKKT